MTEAACATCGRPLVARGPTEVTTGAVSARVEGVDRVRCPTGHDAEAAVPDLVELLRGRIDAELPAARRTRVRGRLRCGACDAPLTIPGRRTTRSVSSRVPGTGVVRVTFDLPMIRCPGCGLDQVPPEVARGDIPSAIAEALC